MSALDTTTLPDDAPENYYRDGYTRIWQKGGTYDDAPAGEHDAIVAQREGTGFWILCHDLTGDEIRIVRGEVTSIARCTRTGIERQIAYLTWREERRKAMRPFDA